jgi:carbamoyltransferase
VYAVRQGRFEYLHEVSAFNSLGNYYAYATHLCGFRAMKHEGKVTGLAAHGEPKYVPLLDEFITEHGGSFVNRGGVVNRAAIEKLARVLPLGWTREDLAASIQRHFEDLAARFVRHWLRVSGLADVALAGGVFANVRVNQEILAIDECDRIFVHPHMGDGGLAAGAALAACVPRTLDRPLRACPEPLPDAFLGTSLTDKEIGDVLHRHALRSEELSEPLEEVIAELLMRGHVVARAHGAMEYGPRALGNRSILYHPTDATVNDWLNARLQRTEFMPFAPALLHEQRHRCLEQLSGGEHAAEFMTVTCPCTPWMRQAMPGVVHLDHTARPQLVRRDRHADFHRIIAAFYRRTGLPAVINTSFNMHEEPIVCSAEDCVRAFLAGQLDCLAIGNHLVVHPRGVTRRLIPVQPRPQHHTIV